MSYFRLLGLAKEPFSTSPDPGLFYETDQHKAVFYRLRSAIEMRRGLSVVLGDVGTGKTTLGRKLSQVLGDDARVIPVMIFQPFYETESLFLQELCRRFGINVRGRESSGVHVYLQALEKFLFDKCVKGRKCVVLFVDEAQKLTLPCLEVLRSLLNYETNDCKTLQLVLFGQMELLSRLQCMPNFLDRIAFRAVLGPLDETAVAELIDFRVRQAGYSDPEPLFTRSAIRAVHAAALGYPRKVTMLCHDVLERVVMREGTMVLEEDVAAVIGERRAWNELAQTTGVS